MAATHGLAKEDKECLLILARQAIAHYIETGGEMSSPKLGNPELAKPAATFVSLHIGKDLRGCVGTLEPVFPLCESICKNALAAAFGDPRFDPLSKEELEKVAIEISVLSPLRPISFSSHSELLDAIVPGKHGLLIELDGHSATFLPQVWKEIPEKELFLSHLCAKAGLHPDAWKKRGLRAWVYEADVFGELRSNKAQHQIRPNIS